MPYYYRYFETMGRTVLVEVEHIPEDMGSWDRAPEPAEWCITRIEDIGANKAGLEATASTYETFTPVNLKRHFIREHPEEYARLKLFIMSEFPFLNNDDCFERKAS